MTDIKVKNFNLLKIQIWGNDRKWMTEKNKMKFNDGGNQENYEN